MEFTVKRSKWLRGTDDGDLLHPSNNKMCCLGFVCRQMGLRAMQIRAIAMPDGLPDSLREKLIGALTHKTASDVGKSYKWVEGAAQINDSYELTNEKRERKLKTLFSKNGHRLKFID